MLLGAVQYSIGAMKRALRLAISYVVIEEGI
jgi:hypothetical protein